MSERNPLLTHEQLINLEAANNPNNGIKFDALLADPTLMTDEQIANMLSASSNTGESLQSVLFTSPTQRQVISAGSTINITSISDASSLTYEYQKTDGTWVEIGAATNIAGVWTYSNWAVPSVPFVAIRGKGDNRLGQVNVWPRVLYDTFTGTDGTLLSAHTPNEAWGTAWNVVSGNWKITSNTLGIDNADTNVYHANIETNSVDAIIKVKFTTKPSATSIPNIIFRYTDANNNIGVRFGLSGVNVIVRIFERVAGVATTLFADATIAWTSSTEYEIRCIENKVFITSPLSGDIKSATVSVLTGTRHGVQRAGVNGTYQYDDFQLLAVGDQPITTLVQYSAAKLGSLVMSKNELPPLDTYGLAGLEIIQHNGVNYGIFAVKNSSSVWHGLSYATADPSDPHTWTRFNGRILNSGTSGQWDDSITDCSIYFSDTEVFVVYSGRTSGIIGYAKGPDLENLTKQSQIVDLSAQGIYCRHPNLLVRDGVFYLYFDSRRDQPSGELGEIWVISGPDLDNLTDAHEVLSTPGYDFDEFDLTAPAVRYNASNGYYEMAYSGYKGGGTPYFHQTGIAISKSPLGPFVRTSEAPLIANGAGQLDQTHAHDPCWLPDTDIIYYTAADAAGASADDQYDGFTYATLTLL